MEGKFEKGQLVWAKIKTFPWWPAIIDKIEKLNAAEPDEEPEYQEEITVKFIGENTHATLSSSDIHNYQETYNEHCIVKQKKLKNCILIADKIASKEINLSELPEINNNLGAFIDKIMNKTEKTRSSSSETESDEEPKPRKNQKIEKSEDNEAKRLKEINKQIDIKLTQSDKNIEHSRKRELENINAKLSELSSGLSTHLNNEENKEETKEPLLVVNDLCDHLGYLIQNNPENSVLESSKILKTLKLFREKHKENPNQNYKVLSEICYKLYLYWKKCIINEKIKISITPPAAATPKPPRKPKIDEKPKEEQPKKSKTDEKPKEEKLKDEKSKEEKPKEEEPKKPVAKTPRKINKKPAKPIEKEETKEIHKPATEETTDWPLRKKVCRKLAKIITERGILKAQSQDYALELEKKLREKDPQMKTKYKEAFINLRGKLANRDKEIEKTISEFLKE